MTVDTLELGYSVFNFCFSVPFDRFMAGAAFDSGMTSIQRKPCEVVIKVAWKPCIGIVASFAYGDAVCREPITVNIPVAVRA